MIFDYGVIELPQEVIEAAESIKHLNYKVTTPTKFQKNTLVHESLKDAISLRVRVPKEKLDYVYFSCISGAEPHVDQLDPAKFTDRTFVIPIILPEGNTLLYSQGDYAVCEVGRVFEFNHEKIHSLEVNDIQSGCVVIMASVLK